MYNSRDGERIEMSDARMGWDGDLYYGDRDKF